MNHNPFSASPFLSSALTKPPRERGYGERLLDSLSEMSPLQALTLPATGAATALGGGVRGLTFGLLDPTDEIHSMLGKAAPPAELTTALEVAGEIGGSFVPYIGAASAASRVFRGADLSARLLRGATTFGAPELLRQALHQETDPKAALRSLVTGAAFSLPLSRPLLAPTVAASELLMGADPLQAGIAGSLALLFGPMEGHRTKADVPVGGELDGLKTTVDTDLQALTKLASEAKRKAHWTPRFSTSPRPQFHEEVVRFVQEDLLRKRGVKPRATRSRGKSAVKKAVEEARASFKGSGFDVKRVSEEQLKLPFTRRELEKKARVYAERFRPKSQVELIDEAATKAGALTDRALLEAISDSPYEVAKRETEAANLEALGDFFEKKGATLSKQRSKEAAKKARELAKHQRRPKVKGFDPDSHTMTDFISLSGGIRPDKGYAGELRDLAGERGPGGKFLKGYRKLITKKGDTPDGMRQKLVEAGFLKEEASIGEMWEALAEDLRHKNRWSILKDWHDDIPYPETPPLLRTEAQALHGEKMVDEVLLETGDGSLLGVRFPEPGKAFVGQVQVPKGKRGQGQLFQLLKALRDEVDSRGVATVEANVVEPRLKKVLERFNKRTPLGRELEVEAARVKTLANVDETKLAAGLAKSIETNGPEATKTKTIQRALAEKKGGYVPAHAPTVNSLPPKLQGADAVSTSPDSPFVARAAREKVLAQMRASADPAEHAKAAQLEELYKSVDPTKPLSLREARKLLAKQESILESSVVKFDSPETAISTAKQEMAQMMSEQQIDSFSRNLPEHYKVSDGATKEIERIAKQQKKLLREVKEEGLSFPQEVAVAAEVAGRHGLVPGQRRSGQFYAAINGQALDRKWSSLRQMREWLGDLESGKIQPKDVLELRALAYPRMTVIDYGPKGIHIINQVSGENVTAKTIREAAELVRGQPVLLDAAPELMPLAMPKVPGPGGIGGLVTEQAPPLCPPANVERSILAAKKLMDDMGKGFPTDLPGGKK